MKKLLGILVLGLFLTIPSQADDIRDFQLEGMSIGDSALDYFDESNLKKNKENWYDTTIYTPIAELYLSNSKTYESFQIAVKTNDKKYKMVNISGFVFYRNNDINKCYLQLDEISNEIKILFKNVKDLGKKTYKHSYDKSGKTKVTDIVLRLSDGGEISIQCVDWAEKYTYLDQLRINIDTKEYQRASIMAAVDIRIVFSK